MDGKKKGESKDYLKKPNDLMQFLANFAVISTFISFALGFSFSKIMQDLSDGIIQPTLQLIFSFFGAKRLYFSIRGQQFKLYPIISGIITFVIIFGMLYGIFAKALKPTTDKIISLQNNNKNSSKRL